MALGFGTTATYQFYRTERWLARLEAIYLGKYVPVGNFDDTIDQVLAFFLNCYHVKDWLKNGPEWQDDVDPSVKRRAIEQFVNESAALQICADICNGGKHFSLKNGRSETPPTLKVTHNKVDTTTGAPVKSTRFTLRTARGDADAYELASECVEAWRGFIRGSTQESLHALANRNTAAHRASPSRRSKK